MPRSRPPRKNVSALTVAKNIVRGSKDPRAAVARALAHVPPALVPDFLTWAERARFRKTSALAAAFPASLLSLLSSALAEPGDFDDELTVLTSRLMMYEREMNAFIVSREALGAAVSRSDYATSEQILEGMQREFGDSIWLVEMRLAIAALHNGLEAQKRLSESIREQCGRSPTNTIAYYTSQRNEPSTSAVRFLVRIEALLARSALPTSAATYYRYHLCRTTPQLKDDFQGLLLVEARSSLIDSYEAFVSIALEPAALSESAPDLLRHLQRIRHLNDSRLAKLYFLLGLTNESCLRTRSLSLDHALLSDAPVSLEEAEIDADDYRALWVAGMHRCAKGGDSEAQIPLNREWQLHVAIALSDVKRAGEAINAFTKWAFNLKASSAITSLASLMSDVIDDGPPLTAHSYYRALVSSPYLDPWDLLFIPEVSRARYLSALQARYGDAPLLRFVAWLSSDSEEPAPSTLSIRWRAFGDVYKAYRRGQFDRVIAITRELQEDSLFHAAAIRWHSNGLLKLGLTRETVAYAANLLASSSAYQGLLPIDDLLGTKKWSELQGYADEVGLAVLLDFQWRETGQSEVSSFRRYAAEDFLSSRGIDRPSQLGPQAGAFNRRTLVYFLSNVCVPDVLDLMMAFPSSRSVQEERRAINALLVELDPDNSQAYRDAIASLTRSLMLDEGVRLIDRSRLFVDKEGVVRWAEREIRESFDRYKALLSAGVGFDADAFSLALRKFVANQEAIPEELLSLNKGEADDLMLKLVSDLRDNFLLSPTHGLDAFLSMRVRHGTLSGMLRGPLEQSHIINQRKSGTTRYQRNTYWTTVLEEAPLEHIARIEAAIAEFSEGFDAAIDLLRTRLQIRRKDRPLGLFDITLSRVHILVLKAEISPDTPLDRFVRAAVDVFWVFLENSLRDIQSFIGKDFRSMVGALFEVLEGKLQTAMPGIRYWRLNEAVHQALTNVQSAMDSIRGWFQRDEGSKLTHSISHAVDVAMEVVRVTYRNFEPKVERRIADDEIVVVGSITVVVDILFTALDNVYRRSGIERDGLVIIEVRKADVNAVVIAVENEVGPDYDYAIGRKRVEDIREQIRRGEFRTSVVSGEGGTGLLKVKGLVDPNGERDNALSFGFTSAGRFRVEVTLQALEVESANLAG